MILMAHYGSILYLWKIWSWSCWGLLHRRVSLQGLAKKSYPGMGARIDPLTAK